MENIVKDSFVNIRVTEQLKEKLVKEARLKKVTVSKFANNLFDKHFKEKELKVAPILSPTIVNEKPIDLKFLIIAGSILSVMLLIWHFVSNKPTKNEFQKLNEEK